MGKPVGRPRRSTIPISQEPSKRRKIDESREAYQMPGTSNSDVILPKADDLSTIPPGLRDVKPAIQTKSVICRIHPNDHPVLKVLLKKDRLTFQKFFEYVFRGYLDADPWLIKFLQTARELDEIPADVQNKHCLSHRERNSIYEALEQSERLKQAEDE
jgi:hypothetical protein